MIESLLDACQFVLAPNERCWVDRKSIGSRLQRAEFWKIKREVRNNKLIKVLRVWEVLETVFPEIA